MCPSQPTHTANTHSADDRASMADTAATAPLTVAALFELCHLCTPTELATSSGYRPTPAQIAFFTLIWAARLGAHWQAVVSPLMNGEGDMLSPPLVQEHTTQVAGQLDEWGAAVTGLQQRNAREWELLRIQLDKALRGKSPDHADDALQEALITIFQMVHHMTPGDTIDSAADVAALAAASFPAHAAAYRFDRPFYPYAKRIAENQLYTHFRQRRRWDKDALSLDEWEEILLAPESVDVDTEGEAAALRRLLAEELKRLLQLLGSELTPKPRQVVLATLAARPQFWTALRTFAVPAPAGLEPLPHDTNDAELARRLAIVFFSYVLL